MIFVTVGTHEQQFNRLVEYIDKLRENGVITEDVVIQTGYSTYEPKHCIWKAFFPYMEMLKNVNNARIVITHGGPSSFIMPLQIGKTPIVVPRQKKYDEHVNNHQVKFCNEVAERKGTIIVANEVSELEKIIKDYDLTIEKIRSGVKSNNERFNEELERIVENMFERKK